MKHNNSNWIFLSIAIFLSAWFISDVIVVVSAATTVRYRQGYLPGDSLHIENSISVAGARDYCMKNPKCVSFAFQSPFTRFPPQDVTAFFYSYADWHVMSSGEPAFVEDPSWHSYVNVTREHEAVPKEIDMVLDQLKNGAPNLRGTKAIEHKLILLEALFHIVFPKSHKSLAAPRVVPDMVSLVASTNEAEVVRQTAIQILVVLADTEETGQILFDAGVFEATKKIINQRKTNEEGQQVWDETSKIALDAISNICLHRAANSQLRKAGAHAFLESLLSDPGFPGLQASMALTHLGIEHVNMPHDKVESMVELLRTTIDGDVTYDILWELIPGPLSAINFLVLHSDNDKEMIELMLDAGLMEQLLRVLEAECLDASHVETALEIMQALSSLSERARHTILLAEHSLHEVESRLKEYSRSAKLASQLTSTVAKDGYVTIRNEL